LYYIGAAGLLRSIYESGMGAFGRPYFQGSMPHCVLIVDDNIQLRRVIRVQAEAAGLEVCGEAVDGLDAIEKARVLKPDLIILDLSMPRMNGLDAARELSEICPNIPILLYTMHADVIRRSSELPTGITAVVAKTENLMARIMENLALV
jgi:CheY-like chemotaxis protein